MYLAHYRDTFPPIVSSTCDKDDQAKDAIAPLSQPSYGGDRRGAGPLSGGFGNGFNGMAPGFNRLRMQSDSRVTQIVADMRSESLSHFLLNPLTPLTLETFLLRRPRPISTTCLLGVA
jgi:hypothetical protein